MGRGLGLVDVHLLASAMIGRALISTADHKLQLAARDLGIAFRYHPVSG